MYKVLLRNNETGEEREHIEDHEWDGDFLWVDGNYGCDCNRGLLFAWAGGEDDPDVPCGSERYTAVCAILPGGERTPLDEEQGSNDSGSQGGRGDGK